MSPTSGHEVSLKSCNETATQVHECTNASSTVPGTAEHMPKKGKGVTRRSVLQRVKTHADLDTLLESMVQRATVILRAHRPRQHSDFRLLRSQLTEIVEHAPESSEVATHVRAIIDRLNSA